MVRLFAGRVSEAAGVITRPASERAAGMPSGSKRAARRCVTLSLCRQHGVFRPHFDGEGRERLAAQLHRPFDRQRQLELPRRSVGLPDEWPWLARSATVRLRAAAS